MFLSSFYEFVPDFISIYSFCFSFGVMFLDLTRLSKRKFLLPLFTRMKRYLFVLVDLLLLWFLSRQEKSRGFVENANLGVCLSFA